MVCAAVSITNSTFRLPAHSTCVSQITHEGRDIADELVPREIRVNCVAPGPVWTPLDVADKSAADAARHGQDTPMKRPAQPEEIAPAYVFFSSAADSGYITGEVRTLTGGEPSAA